MTATLVIANTGKKGKRQFVLRARGPKRAKRAASKRTARRNPWSEAPRHPVLKAIRHRAAAFKGHGRSPQQAGKLARMNPGEYLAAFNRLKSDVTSAARKVRTGARKARYAAQRIRSAPRRARAALGAAKSHWRANPAAPTSVAQRLAALRGRLARPNPTRGASARKEKTVAKKARRSRKIGTHARKVKAYMKSHRGASLAQASKAVARHNPGKPSKKTAAKKSPAKKRKSMSKSALKARLAALTSSSVSGRTRRYIKQGKSKDIARAQARADVRLARSRMSKSARKSARKAGVVRKARIAGIRARLTGSKTLSKFGLTRVNPSFSGVAKDVMAILPEMGVAALSFVGVAVGAKKLMAEWLPDSIKDLWKGKDAEATARNAAYAPVLAGGLIAILGYVGARMYPKTAKYAAPVAFGGVAGAVLHLLSAVSVKVKDASGVEVSKKWGAALGLPLSEYVSVAGLVDVGGGRMMHVNGIGEYVSVAGVHRMALPGGQSMRYEGSLSEYVMDPVGLSGARGIFPDEPGLGALVDHTRSQIPLKRDPMWGLRGDPEGNVNILKLLGQGEAGMAGGIFDRAR